MADAGISLLEETEQPEFQGDPPNKGGWVIESPGTRPKDVHPASTKPKWLWKKVSSWWITREFLMLIKLFIPITLTLIFQQLTLFVSFLFVGQIEGEGSLNLDAVALGSSFVNITGFSIGVGISSASDTLSAQTYGYGNYKQVGVIFQRGLLIVLFISAFIICAWLNTETILLLFQQQPCVARYSAVFVNIFILGLPSILLYVMLQKYLQTQNIVWPFIFVGLLTNIVSAVAHAIFIFGLSMGIEGVSVALVIANLFQPAVLIVYMKVRKLHKKTWEGWSWESLQQWPQYLKLGIPGMLMICIEWISFEASAIVLGTINEIELAVHGILLSYLTIIFMVPLGLSIAISVRVGNELGAGNARAAKRSAFVAIGMITVNALSMITLTQCLKNHLGGFYNAEEEVRRKLKPVINVACVMLFADQVQAVMSGIVRGAGHQFRGSMINLVAYYVLGLPIGISLALAADMRSLGMWIGLAVGPNVQAICLAILLVCLNWKKEAQLAMRRGKGKVSDEEAEGSGSVVESSKVIVKLKTYNLLINHQEDSEDDSELTGGDTEGDLSEAKEKLLEEQELEHNAENQVANCLTSLPLTEETAYSSQPEEDIGSVSDEEGESYRVDEMRPTGRNYSNHIHPLLQTLRLHMKLIFCHSSLFLMATVCLLVSGIASRFHPPDSILNGNYSDCSNISCDACIL